jgi:hypothetical protein
LISFDCSLNFGFSVVNFLVLTGSFVLQPQSSFHTAWGKTKRRFLLLAVANVQRKGLPPHHDDFIEFLGLRAADGEEAVFEVLEEGSHLFVIVCFLLNLFSFLMICNVLQEESLCW